VTQKKRIGDRLLEAGLITQEHLDIAVQEQKKTGELLGAILFSHGFVSQNDLLQVLSCSHDGSAEALPREESVDIPEELAYLVKQSSSAFQGEGAGKKESDFAQAPIVMLVEKLIASGISKGATDIHIGPDTKGTRVRYRVDGKLHHAVYLPKDLLNPLVSRIKIIGHMNIAESRLPQDGGAEVPFKNRKVDLRISTFPVTGGENVVVRILDKSQLTLGLESLGYLTYATNRIHEILKLPFGMILVTGPTGSGKTTTLYSCLTAINTVSKHIFTIEDPVEYQMPLVRQAQVNVKAGLTFARGLRSILRQDPDVILVGEMRDIETAELAVSAALTGHLVFSTLHTNDAVSSIMRMIDMGIEPFLVSATLDAVIGQRLVRLLCQQCKEEIPSGSFEAVYEKMKTDPAKGSLYRARGCEACGETGYAGRTVIYEILIVTPEIKDMISRRASLADVRQQAKKEGFMSMSEIGIEKVRMGLTSFEELSSVTRTEEL
jgi:type II secretory ATPase GspE/PulE/Tfp pilus assembly ATPase PilB-like protein